MTPVWVRSVGGAIAAGCAAAVVVGMVVGAGVAADVAFVVGAIVGVVVGARTRRLEVRHIGAAFAGVFAMTSLVFASSAADVAGAVFLACAVGAVVWAGRASADGAADIAAPSAPSAPYVVSAVVVFVVGVVVYSAYSLERHTRFGSGSWDYGCYVHNAWLFAHGDAFSSAARSSVLGDVAFWGGTNHFMPSLVLTAPLSWLMEGLGSTSALSVAQNIVVMATVFPLAWLCRARGMAWPVATVVGLAFALHPGVQAALLFDVHEVAPIPLVMATAMALSVSTSMSTPRPRHVAAMVALVMILAGTKESSWLVAATLCVGIAWWAPAWRRVAVVLALACAVGFVVVVGVVQPGLLEPGAQMLHTARFPGIGPTPASSLSAAALSYALHPGQMVLAVFHPVEKLRTLSTSTAAMGGLSWASAPAVVVGLSNVAERFLSDKREMWGMAFHYGLVTAGWMALAALDVVAGARARRRPLLLAFVAIGVVVAAVTSPRPYDLLHYQQPYYASDAQVARYQRALALVNHDDAVVAQNHFLPHLALRRHIWQPERRFVDRADVVVLDSAASPWPHPPRHIRGLIESLRGNASFQVAFHEGTTWVFRRR
jgi:uncharacterized membrane protein